MNVPKAQWNAEMRSVVRVVSATSHSPVVNARTGLQGHTANDPNPDATRNPAHQAIPHARYLANLLKVIYRESLS